MLEAGAVGAGVDVWAEAAGATPWSKATDRVTAAAMPHFRWKRDTWVDTLHTARWALAKREVQGCAKGIVALERTNSNRIRFSALRNFSKTYR